jgi:cell division protein FtsL
VGSAARKIEVTAPVKKVQRPKAKTNKRIIVRVDPVACLGILTAAIMLVVMFASFMALQNTQQEAATMARYVQELRVENEKLKTELENGYNLEQVERTAKALGMVSEDQVKHVTLQVTQENAVENTGVWARFCALVSGLFA